MCGTEPATGSGTDGGPLPDVEGSVDGPAARPSAAAFAGEVTPVAALAACSTVWVTGVVPGSVPVAWSTGAVGTAPAACWTAWLAGAVAPAACSTVWVTGVVPGSVPVAWSTGGVGTAPAACWTAGLAGAVAVTAGSA